MGAPKKLRLGEILIEQGVLDPESLQRALAKQKVEGGMLGEVLIKMGLVREEDIVVALAEQFNFPYLPIQNCNINANILKVLSKEFVTKNLLMPIDRIHDVLTVIMVDPSNERVKQEIKEMTKCRVQALVGSVSEIVQAIKKYYKIKDVIVDTDNSSANVSKMSFRDVTAKKVRTDEGDKEPA